MATKNPFQKLASKAQQGLQNYTNHSVDDETAKTAQTAASAATTSLFLIKHWKALLVGLIIGLLIMIIGIPSSIVSTTVLNARSLDDCSSGVNKDELVSALEATGQLTDQDRSDLNALKDNTTCKKQGMGYTGEAFPPALGTLTAVFGEDRGDHKHAGIDIGNSCGTQIYAFAGGVVEHVTLGSEAHTTSGSFAYPMGDLVIKHTDTFKTRYLHMNGSSFLVKEGDVVSAGQPIASIWDNGFSFGCHLHVEAYVDNKPTDLLPILKGCGFDYNLGEYFGTLPPAPVMCGDGGIKDFAKSQLTTLLGIPPGSADTEFQCLDNLWNRESNWRTNAQNNDFDVTSPHTPFYQAYGIPQAAPGSKMASVGEDWQTNPQTQVKWGLGYIKDRYGTPCAAWSHSEANNWY